MDNIWYLCLIFAGILLFYWLFHSKTSTSHTRYTERNISPPFTNNNNTYFERNRNPMVWTPGNISPVNESVETYNIRNNIFNRSNIFRNFPLESLIRYPEREMLRIQNKDWINVDGEDEVLETDEANEANEANEETNNTLRCKICMENKINTVLLPCFHVVCCTSCANQLRTTRVCPICRNRIETPRKIFL